MAKIQAVHGTEGVTNIPTSSANSSLLAGHSYSDPTILRKIQGRALFRVQLCGQHIPCSYLAYAIYSVRNERARLELERPSMEPERRMAHVLPVPRNRLLY